MTVSNDSIKTLNEDDEFREEYDLAQLPVVPKGRYAPK
jgi:hypothetical protein